MLLVYRQTHSASVTAACLPGVVWQDRRSGHAGECELGVQSHAGVQTSGEPGVEAQPEGTGPAAGLPAPALHAPPTI